MSDLQFEIDPSNLDRFALEHAESHKTAAPFPHTVIEDFASPDALRGVIEEFPTKDHPNWTHMFDPDQNKFASNDMRLLGPRTRHMIQALNDAPVINFLEKLTGISGLVPDPHLAGGGLHEMRPGGMLRVHADFNFHKQILLDRRINLLLYLNENWQTSYGGQLELWDTEMRGAVKTVEPVFNRCVIFETTDNSYHGNPNPVSCPPDRTRRSIAMYYYTNGRPEKEVSSSHGTLFRKRPGEGTAKEVSKDLVRDLFPPILWNAMKEVRKRTGI